MVWEKEVQITPAVEEVGDKLIFELIGSPQGKEEVEVALAAGKISQESPDEVEEGTPGALRGWTKAEV